MWVGRHSSARRTSMGLSKLSRRGVLTIAIAGNRARLSAAQGMERRGTGLDPRRMRSSLVVGRHYCRSRGRWLICWIERKDAHHSSDEDANERQKGHSCSIHPAYWRGECAQNAAPGSGNSDAGRRGKFCLNAGRANGKPRREARTIPGRPDIISRGTRTANRRLRAWFYESG